MVFGYGVKYKRVTYRERPRLSAAEWLFLGILLVAGGNYLVKHSAAIVGDAITWLASFMTFGVVFLVIYSTLDKTDTQLGWILSTLSGTLAGVELYVDYGAQYNFAPFIFRDAYNFITTEVATGNVTLVGFCAFLIVLMLAFIDYRVVRNIIRSGAPFVRRRRGVVQEVVL